MVTSANEAGHGELEIVQRTTYEPAPLVGVNVALGVVAFGLNVPVPPLCIVHIPVPEDGVLPPSPEVALLSQIVCGPPTVAVVGDGEIVMVTSANEAGQGELEIVQRRTIGPLPPVCVKVALGVVAFGLKVPAPPLCTVHMPVPLVGVLPPSPAVVVHAQMVWFEPTVAVVGDCVTVMTTSADELAHGGLEIVHRSVIMPVPPV